MDAKYRLYYCLAKVVFTHACDAAVALQVSCGAEHSVLLTDVGTVMTFGCGKFGRLGHGDDTSQPLPKLVEELHRRRERVVAVSAGGEHTLALTTRRSVYAWGNGQCGRLGLGIGQTEDALVPKHVTSLRSVAVSHIAAGLAHSLVTTTTGQVFAFGWGAFGQLGLGSADDACIPTPITALFGQFIVQSSAGAQHSVFLSATGAVFSCGKATRGRLGTGDNTRRLLPTELPQFTARQARPSQQSVDESAYLKRLSHGGYDASPWTIEL